MPRPQSDKVMVSIRLAASGVSWMGDLAKERHEPISETHRTMLRYAMHHMPRNWKP